jgi:mannitol/fructose-specific phosphotransferase system IIA component (Ntr-type)
MGKHQEIHYGYVQNPFISNLLTAQHVFVNPGGAVLTKKAVLEQLCDPHVEKCSLQKTDIIKHVQEAEQRQTVVLRPGFAVAHGALPYGPRISITFGVYPDGIDWSPLDDPVRLVAMVICAKDTYRTWRDYMKKFAILFRSKPKLQKELTAAKSNEEFVALLRNAEISLVKAQ